MIMDVLTTATRAATRVRSRYPWVDPDDLRQHAAVAILCATKTWRADGGANLQTYCNRAADMAIRDYLRRESRATSHLTAREVTAVVRTNPEALVDGVRRVRQVLAVTRKVRDGHLGAAVLVDGYTPRRVAAMHRVNVGAVYRAIYAVDAALEAGT